MSEKHSVEDDLPEVQVDTREPLARSLKRAGITADDEVIGEDRKLRDTEEVAQEAKDKKETKKA